MLLRVIMQDMLLMLADVRHVRYDAGAARHVR